MDPKITTLDEALNLLSLPRTVGTDPDTKEAITAHNGRYGPYLKRGNDNRSLETEEQIFTVTVEEAQTLFKQPKRRRGQRAARTLKELGEDPESKKPISVKDGRYGPYITDGTTNVSLARGEEVESIALDDALSRLVEKRAQDPPPRKRRSKKKT